MAAKPSRPRELYRDPAHGKIAGICAGLGRYFDWPVWPIRLALVVLAVFTQFFPLVAVYLIAWFVLDPLSNHSPPGLRGQLDGWVRSSRSRWDQGGGSASEATREPEPATVESAPASSTGGRPAAAATVSPAAMWTVPPDLEAVEAAFAELEWRVQALERHVTAPAFVLREQFRQL